MTPSETLRFAVERALGASHVRWCHAGPTGWGEAWSASVADQRYFIKFATGSHADLLACEADGLRALAATRTIHVPAVILAGAEGATAYLVMEWLDLAASAGAGALGTPLAALHRAAAPRGPKGERFGWHRDNWIGGTPQSNAWHDDWCTFFRERRLVPQLTRALRNGFSGDLERNAERLLGAMPALLRGHTPSPSLVHGDLWSGNAGTLRNGEPVVFDPAVYVGDREVDLAMSELFGGFGEPFLRAYASAWPLDEGYPARRDLYNLYHLLNHLNLFGGGYLARTQRTLARIVAETTRY